MLGTEAPSLELKNNIEQYFANDFENIYEKIPKQAGAELGQAQP